MFGKMGDMGKMMKQMKEMEKALSKVVVEGKSKNNFVTVSINGKLDLQSVTIEQELVDKKDRTLLEKSVQEAFQKAIQEAQSTARSQIKIPGM